MTITAPNSLSAVLVVVMLVVLVFLVGQAAADTGHAEDSEHIEESVIAVEATGVARLLENRIIYLIGSLVLMTLLTWGVFVIVRNRPVIEETTQDTTAE